MAAPKDELSNVDEAWEEPPVAAQAQPVAVSSLPPDLGDLDDGWSADSSPAATVSLESARGAKRADLEQEAALAPPVAWLSKRQRRELAKQQQRHAIERRAERKRARKLERREQAKQQAAERPSSVVVRVAAKETQGGRAREAAATARAASGVEARRGPSSTSGMARPRRSSPEEPQRKAERNGAVRAPASAGRQRKTSWALYLLMAAAVAALGAWAWLG